MRRRLVPVLAGLAAVLAVVRRRSRRRDQELPAPPTGSAAPPAGRREALPASPRQLDAATTPPAGNMETEPGESPVATGSSAQQPQPAPDTETQRRFTGSGPHFLSVAWRAEPDPPPTDAESLEIRFGPLDERMELDRIDVRETASQVFVTVLARFEPRDGERSVHVHDERATITLSTPLGDRALVHTPHDHPDGRPLGDDGPPA